MDKQHGAPMTSEQGTTESGNTFPCTGEIHLLDDDPVQEDEFGAHDALADAIARLVEKEPGGKAIALEGRWGSGKSTVIELLKAKLTANRRGKVFVFDSWAHEGDSLRRALVEEFKKWVESGDNGQSRLIPQLDTEEEEWKERKADVEKLARRLGEQTIKTTVTLSDLGRVMVVLLALLPVGAVLAANFVGWPRWLGLGLTATPLLLLLGVAVCIEFGKCAAPDFDQVLGIFLKQAQEETETKAWSTPDPTSIEFAETFQKLVGNVLRWMGDDQKLVVVLDNLDRLPSYEAVRALATVRVLFEHGINRPAYMSGFWLLVPYDAASLHGEPAAAGPIIVDSLFGDLGMVLAQPARSPTNESGPEHAFRQKFFQTRFRLPQPVQLRWQEYLKNCLKRALLGHRDDEALFESICSLFELVRKRDSEGVEDAREIARYNFPTPREVKLFINRLVAIHMQWPCEKTSNAATTGESKGGQRDRVAPIPLILQAGFALCEKRVDGDLSKYVPGWRNEGFFAHSELRLILKTVEQGSLGGGQWKQWERQVAAMWYGVPQEAALHMLLRPPIHEAFLQGVLREGYADDKLPYQRLLDSRAIDGFWEIAQMVAREHLGSPDTGAFERCARTLAVLAEWREQSEEWTNAWKAVEADAINVLRDHKSTLDRSQFSPVGGRNLARAIGINEASRDLASVGLEILSRVPDGMPDDYYPQWARGTVALMGAMMGRGWEGEIVAFRVPSSPSAYVYLASAATEYESLKKLGVNWIPGGGPDKIMTTFQDAFQRSGLPLECALGFDWLLDVHPDWPWERLADKVRAILLGTQTQGQMQRNVRLFLVRGLRKLLERRRGTNEEWVGVLKNLKGTIQQMVSMMRNEIQTAADAVKEQIAAEVKEWEAILAML